MEGDILFEAARNGKVDVLEKILEENPSILADIRLVSLEKTLVHTAIKSDQLNFVKKILSMDPDCVLEQDKNGLRPLDIAVIMGKLEMVKEILCSKEINLIRLKGKEQRTALHYAAIKGRVDIIEKLLSICSEAIEDTTAYGETALHLSVRNCRTDAFVALIKVLESVGKQIIINLGDGDGNTVLHLAVSSK